jgi:hypothetical protein
VFEGVFVSTTVGFVTAGTLMYDGIFIKKYTRNAISKTITLIASQIP